MAALLSNNASAEWARVGKTIDQPPTLIQSPFIVQEIRQLTGCCLTTKPCKSLQVAAGDIYRKNHSEKLIVNPNVIAHFFSHGTLLKWAMEQSYIQEINLPIGNQQDRQVVSQTHFGSLSVAKNEGGLQKRTAQPCIRAGLRKSAQPLNLNVRFFTQGSEMKKATKLRLIGGGVLLFNLWLIGNYNLEGIPVLLLTFGFAGGYEYLVVRPAAKAAQRP